MVLFYNVVFGWDDVWGFLLCFYIYFCGCDCYISVVGLDKYFFYFVVVNYYLF